MGDHRNPDQGVTPQKEEEKRQVFSRSLQKRIEAQTGEKLFSKADFDAEISKALAGMREAMLVHWRCKGCGKCICDPCHTGREAEANQKSVADYLEHIRQLPNSTTDEGVERIRQQLRHELWMEAQKKTDEIIERLQSQAALDARWDEAKLWVDKVLELFGENDALLATAKLTRWSSDHMADLQKQKAEMEKA